MRDWISLHVSVLDSDTWSELATPEARVAWITTLILAAQQPVEGTFDSLAQLERLLRKEGVAGHDQLLECKTIEIQDDGTVSVRGWEKWQRRLRGPSDEPAIAAARQRELYWRRKAEALSASVSDQPPTFEADESASVSDQSSTPPIEEKRREEKRREGGSRARVREDGSDDRDALDRFHELTLIRPWGRNSGRWLTDLQDVHGVAAVVAALESEHKSDGDYRTLLGRVAADLEKTQDREAKAKAKEPRKVDPATAALRAALTAEPEREAVVVDEAAVEAGRKAWEELRSALPGKHEGPTRVGGGKG